MKSRSVHAPLTLRLSRSGRCRVLQERLNGLTNQRPLHRLVTTTQERRDRIPGIKVGHDPGWSSIADRIEHLLHQDQLRRLDKAHTIRLLKATDKTVVDEALDFLFDQG